MRLHFLEICINQAMKKSSLCFNHTLNLNLKLPCSSIAAGHFSDGPKQAFFDLQHWFKYPHRLPKHSGR
jgi:hypothetical protein